MKKNCKRCGSEFEIKNNRHKYCCVECRFNVQKEYKENKMLRCEFCGREFYSTSFIRRCCSEICRDKLRIRKSFEIKNSMYDIAKSEIGKFKIITERELKKWDMYFFRGGNKHLVFLKIYEKEKKQKIKKAFKTSIFKGSLYGEYIRIDLLGSFIGNYVKIMVTLGKDLGSIGGFSEKN